MSEYISKEDISRVLLERNGANKSCLSNARKLGNHEGEQYFQKLVFEDEQIASLIEELSSADVRPNIHGHWEKAKKGITAGELSNLFKCSCCDCELYDNEFNFCPNCGADMREPKEENE